MDKKPGQISSNTLSLRFMQNAAKARQEHEIQVAQAKVRSEEEWELASHVHESLSVGAQVDDQILSYEPSYIPFLFPSANGQVSQIASPSIDEHVPPESSGTVEEIFVTFKRRRKFGKDGKEELEEKIPSDPPSPPSPPSQKPRDDGLMLARKIHSISSHGRAAASPSKPPRRQTHPSPSAHPTPPQVPAAAQTFLKPQAEASRAHDREHGPTRRKRPAHTEKGRSYVAIIDDANEGTPRKKKKRE